MNFNSIKFGYTNNQKDIFKNIQDKSTPQSNHPVAGMVQAPTPTKQPAPIFAPIGGSVMTPEPIIIPEPDFTPIGGMVPTPTPIPEPKPELKPFSGNSYIPSSLDIES